MGRDSWDDDEENDCGGFETYKEQRARKNKGSRDKHRSKRHDLDFMNQDDEDEMEETAAPSSVPSFHGPSSYQTSYHAPCGQTPVQGPVHREHRFGPNTVEFKGNKIDFDGVQEIIPIQSYYLGQQTFGIKFVFTGDKGFYKTIWYGSDIKTRDTDYATAMAVKGKAK
jgi:hypothetical protein